MIKRDLVKVDVNDGSIITPDGRKIVPPSDTATFQQVCTFAKTLEKAYEKSERNAYQNAFSVPIENTNSDYKVSLPREVSQAS